MHSGPKTKPWGTPQYVQIGVETIYANIGKSILNIHDEKQLLATLLMP